MVSDEVRCLKSPPMFQGRVGSSMFTRPDGVPSDLLFRPLGQRSRET